MEHCRDRGGVYIEDLTLKQLPRHSNSKVDYEACMLGNDWACNSINIEIIKMSSPVKCCDIPSDIEVCENKKVNHPDKNSEVIGDSELMVSANTSEKQSYNEFHSIQSKRKQKRSYKLTKKICQSFVCNTTFNNIKHELEGAIELFTQDLGEEEVKLYLENHGG
ncbi:hypothetical protein NPIL_672811 [Nephila pilipes]|uniref:Uncharacterized protein n=1 Tax=Nephila pilipes TaxID=299642 RepID=A0A8X6TC44_NEPPI|nr:hypothetical protein NPIL_672811 [Nephila pilipes]